jgi:hypothetical protein
MPDITITPPDLGGIGNVARGAKQRGGGQQLKEFSVKRGDNGGVLVCETYRKTPPAGRRTGSAFPEMGDYKENPFSPDDGAAVAAHVTGLLGQLGVTPEAESPAEDRAEGGIEEGAAPPMRAAMRGPMGGGAVAGPSGGVARVGPPPSLDDGY